MADMTPELDTAIDELNEYFRQRSITKETIDISEHVTKIIEASYRSGIDRGVTICVDALLNERHDIPADLRSRLTDLLLKFAK